MMDANTITLVAALIAALGGVSSAVIAAVFGVSNARRAASQKLADMRQLWTGDLRNHLADFVGHVYRILNESSSLRSPERKPQKLEDLNADLMRLESYISMKLNHEEPAHHRLANLIGHIRGGTAVFSQSPDPKLSDRIELHLLEMNQVSRFIFKVEWNKARNEIKPPSQRRKKARKQHLANEYATIVNTVTPYLNPLKKTRSD